MKGANNLLVKLMNQRLVRHTLKSMRQATKQELAAKTGLSVVTINALLMDMIAAGEVQQGEMVPSGGGRPSTLYHYNGDYQHAVILYGYQKDQRNYMKLLVVNLFEESVYEEAEYMERVLESSFEEALDRVFAQFPTIRLIAFGLPGAEKDGIVTINDHPALVGSTFIPHYEARYDVPVIFVNDINGAVNGYYHQHCAERESETVVGIYFPRSYPPGAGIIMNGEVYTGYQNYAGEVGHYPLGFDWLTLDYRDEQQITEAVGQLTAMICTVLAPNRIILYGDFWNEGIDRSVKNYAERLLRDSFSIQVTASNQFEQHFEQGLIQITLHELDGRRE